MRRKHPGPFRPSVVESGYDGRTCPMLRPIDWDRPRHLAVRFVLPLELAGRMNQKTGRSWVMAKRERDAVMRAMDDQLLDLDVDQWSTMRNAILECARPLVVLARCSSVEPDDSGSDAFGGKAPIDGLTRLGLIRDDSAKHIDRCCIWRRAKPGKGAFVVEVWV